MEAGTGLCRQEVSDLFFGIGEGGSYGFGAIPVVVEVGAEQVGEEEEFQHEEDDYQLEDYYGPEVTAHGHIAETVGIEIPGAAPEACRALRGCFFF